MSEKDEKLKALQLTIDKLEKTYGKGEPVPLSSYKTHLAGRKGIIVYEVPGWDDASGHADCWEESRCLWRDFGDKAKVILFWDAP
jgi:hypothetical protein